MGYRIFQETALVVGIGSLTAALVWTFLARKRSLLVSYGLLVVALIPWVKYYQYLIDIALASGNAAPCTARAALQSADQAPFVVLGMFLAALLLLLRPDMIRYGAALFPLLVVLYTWVDLGTRLDACVGEPALIDNVAMVWFFIENAFITLLLLAWESVGARLIYGRASE